MDASQYKDYILTLLFLKYVSDRSRVDRGSLVVVPEGCSFEDIVALTGRKQIGEEIDKIIGRLANANGLRGVIDVTSFNDPEKLGSGNEMVDRLSKLVAVFDELDLRAGHAGGDDLLGDAYEYLMRHFATESGKSKGQFYTPAEVSRVIAGVVGIDSQTKRTQTIYDPTCGSGSLLLKAVDEAPQGLSIYGQEKDGPTWALAEMNMILHGNETADLGRGDVIASPHFAGDGELKKHDFVVANPPFSTKSWSNGISPAGDEYHRFEIGVPPTRNGDYAFLLHVIKSTKSTGKAAVILPHGVLFRGGAEAKIRRGLIERHLIKGVIGLPTNLFYGTGIPACVVVIDKEGAAERDAVFLLDAADGFAKDGAKNRLRARDIHRIIDVFTRQIEIEGYSRLVPIAEIAEAGNDFNLNLPRYIDPGEPDDLQDLDGHLNGGVPDHDLDLLADFWVAFPGLRGDLFQPERTGYCRLHVESGEIRPVIEANPNFAELERRLDRGLEEWWAANAAALESIDVGVEPKPLIALLAEDLFRRFEGTTPLLSNYDVYEQLMVYWAEAMQDDVHLVSFEGWLQAARPRSPRQIGVTSSGKPKREEPDLVIGKGKSKKQYKMDLLPPEVVIGRYFQAEEEELKRLAQQADLAGRDADAFVEEHADEGEPLEAVLNDKGAITKTALADYVKFLRDDPDRAEDLKIAERCQALRAVAAAAAKTAEAAEAKLLARAKDKYAELDEAEVRSCVLNDKWLQSVKRAVGGVLRERVGELTTRVRDLDRRYSRTLDDLREEEEALRDKVGSHLAALGTELEQV
jgi:type I restriction enzyme M protein